VTGRVGDHYVVTATPVGGGGKTTPTRCPASGASDCDHCAMPGCADPPSVRRFPSGACRDTDAGKFDYEGFLSPLVLERFAAYMHAHRRQSDGALRPSDNWQRGIPRDEYMKSGWRHFMDWWREHRGLSSRDGLEDALCAVMFNAMGYLLEVLKEKERGPTDG